MPQYQDRTQRPDLLPEGDYIWTVTTFDIGISQSTATKGAENYKAEFSLQSKDGSQTGTCRETLIDHEKTAWKLDCFLKSGGVQIKKGENYEFREDKAQQKGCRFVEAIGLRGWCHVIVDEFDRADKTKGRSNKISIFYTDREMLAPIAQEQPAEDPGF